MKQMLFISERTWRKIREHFTESEKAKLRSAIANNVIAPVRGWDIQVDELESGLQEKVLGAMLDATPAIRPQPPKTPLRKHVLVSPPSELPAD
jgi:hypothetical protein